MIQLGIENKLLMMNKVVDMMAIFEPQMDKSVREHLGFGDRAKGVLKCINDTSAYPESQIGEVSKSQSLNGRGIALKT